ncbi:hypothetical protein CDAR_413651 [Caerostris darwini]|uniref:Uncharacterized protein n=1 Tax=Caerostris darwini TaxID=1538125 RepID=A0AAV4SEZ2_9ARAC|nr:hypothetical protein CDAR_413651 [Caerostris darwini]
METTVLRGVTYQMFWGPENISILFPFEEISGTRLEWCTKEKISCQRSQSTLFSTGQQDIHSRFEYQSLRRGMTQFYDACTRRINKKNSNPGEAFSVFLIAK